MVESRTARTFRGLKWTSASTLANIFLQIIFTAVMARLLDPAAFGLVAMAGVVLRFGSYFAGMGVGAALIQKKEVTPGEIQAAFTSTLLLGILFSALVWTLAPFSRLIFDIDGVVQVVRVMGLTLLFSGLSIPSVSLLRRNLDFRSLAIAETLAFVVGSGGVGISMALFGFGVWSLVGSSLAQSILLAAISFSFCSFPLRLSIRWSTQKELYSYGGRFSVVSFLEFLTYNMDSILIGNLLGSRLLGIYNRASLLINLPSQHMNQSFLKVLFPSLSQIQSDIEKLKSAYMSSVLFLGIGLFSVSLGICAGAEEIVVVVLGREWEEAIPVLRILAVAVPFHLLLHFSGLIFDTTGKLTVKMIVRTAHVMFFFFLYWMLSDLGLIGFALVLLVGETVFYLVYTIIALRILRGHWSEVVDVHWCSILAGVISFIPILAISMILREFSVPDTIILLCEIIVGGLGLFTYIFVIPPKTLRQEITKRFLESKVFESRFAFTQALLSWSRQLLLGKKPAI